jgi:hypothetical protein
LACRLNLSASSATVLQGEQIDFKVPIAVERETLHEGFLSQQHSAKPQADGGALLERAKNLYVALSEPDTYPWMAVAAEIQVHKGTLLRGDVERLLRIAWRSKQGIFGKLLKQECERQGVPWISFEGVKDYLRALGIEASPRWTKAVARWPKREREKMLEAMQTSRTNREERERRRVEEQEREEPPPTNEETVQ